MRRIVVEDLRKRKICSRFVPPFLTPEQKERRIATCRDLNASADSDPDFFKKTVTGDETWCFASIRCMGRRNLVTAEKIAISEVSCEDHVGEFLRLARRNPQRICSEG